MRKAKVPTASPRILARRRACYAALAAVSVLVLGWVLAKYALQDRPAPVADRPTFHRDVAPVLFAHCTPCHLSGQAAPFALITFAEAHKRARQIVDVTSRKTMPPWLPESRPGEFIGQRTLADRQIETLRRWLEQGAVEGPGPAATPPTAPDSWRLGKPDLVVTMPEPFTVPAEGRDIYRNFVLPLPNEARRFVRAIEFQAGNARLVHHAFFRIDSTPGSRQRDRADAAPGFDGLHTPASAQTPEGHFLSWQPGQMPLAEPDDLAWPLETNCDLVVQMHLRPTGKPEKLQASVGFYFSQRPPRWQPLTIGMRRFDLEIPAGATGHVVRGSLPLTADVDVLAVLPHAHFLAREVRAFATLPGGATQPLLHIPQWDINWQGDYRYTKPVALPAGAVVTLEYTYDNSTNNPANPHHPPVPVRYGLQSDDEMAELWLQVLPRRAGDREALLRGYHPRVLQDTIGYNQYLLRQNPTNGHARSEIGKSHVLLGEHTAAETQLRASMQAQPDLDEPHYWLGISLRLRQRSAEARTEFAIATRLNPANGRAWGNLGLVLVELGQPAAAESALRRALALDPNDVVARQTLDEITGAQPPRP